MGKRVPLFCDNVDKAHQEIHERRRQARKLAHEGKFDSALMMLDLAREMVDLSPHDCTLEDALRQDIYTTRQYVNRLRQPSLAASAILAVEV